MRSFVRLCGSDYLGSGRWKRAVCDSTLMCQDRERSSFVSSFDIPRHQSISTCVGGFLAPSMGCCWHPSPSPRVCVCLTRAHSLTARSCSWRRRGSNRLSARVGGTIPRRDGPCEWRSSRCCRPPQRPRASTSPSWEMKAADLSRTMLPVFTRPGTCAMIVSSFLGATLRSSEAGSSNQLQAKDHAGTASRAAPKLSKDLTPLKFSVTGLAKSSFLCSKLGSHSLAAFAGEDFVQPIDQTVLQRVDRSVPVRGVEKVRRPEVEGAGNQEKMTARDDRCVWR